MRARADGSELDWSDTDQRAVDLIRVLAMDAVEQAGSGHPGTAMSLAPAAYVAARVVSMPCLEWFAEQDGDYREHVLPAGVHARVSIEAGITLGWREYVGDLGASVGLEHFGASADYKKLYAEFGITAEHAAQAAHASLATVTAAGGRR
jgi:transketolase